MKTLISLALAIWAVAFGVVAITLSTQQPLDQKKVRIAPLKVGEVAPDFTLEDQNGSKVTLSEARRKSPVVLVFYRGYW
jgi:cytochrome oxidase Cu insertion factor (SCO1/SenC/PrrC family)